MFMPGQAEGGAWGIGGRCKADLRTLCGFLLVCPSITNKKRSKCSIDPMKGT